MSSYDLKILVLSGKGLLNFDMYFTKALSPTDKEKAWVVFVTNMSDFLSQRDREHWDLVIIHDQFFVDNQVDEYIQKLGKRKVVWIIEVVQNYFQLKQEEVRAFHVSLNEKYIKDSMSDLVEYLRGVIAENIEHEMPEVCLSEGG